MKRRKFFASAAAVPAAGSMLAQQAPTPPAGAPPGAGGRAMEVPKLETAIADDAAEYHPKFFNAAQMATLRKLAEILMPAPEGGVGAQQAGAAEFLDFLIGASQAERQSVYLKGLDALNAAAKSKHQKTFDQVGEAEAMALLAPLKKPWTYEPSPDVLTRFLHTAKADVRTATLNSKEYNQNGGGGGRRGGGTGLYWYPID
jgi:hypothetical protein